MTKTVIVTGAAKGIGRAIVEQSLKDGYAVNALDKDPAGLESLAKSIGSDAMLKINVVDVSEADAVSAFFGQFTPQNCPDMLVNNAGIYPAQSLENYTPEQIEQVYRVNVFGAMYMIQGFAHLLKDTEREGIIVNLASVARFGSADAVYGSSKAAIAGLTQCVAMTLAPHIRVNAVAPGIVLTDMQKAVPAHIIEWYRNTELIRKPLQAADVADTVSFLLSERSRNYTGHIMEINNGFHRR